MLRLYNNTGTRQRACPLFTVTQDLLEYIGSGVIPPDAESIPVPESIAVTERCVWIKPAVTGHSWSSIVLVSLTSSASTEGISLLPAGGDVQRSFAYIVGEQLMVGWVAKEEGVSVMKPLKRGVHAPLSLADARLIGTVEAMI